MMDLKNHTERLYSSLTYKNVHWTVFEEEENGTNKNSKWRKLCACARFKCL